MKKFYCFIILSIFIFTSNDVFAQQDTVNLATRDYWNTVFEYSRYVKDKTIDKKPSVAEIDTLAKQYYHAVSDDPVAYQRFWLYLRNQEEDSIKNRLPTAGRGAGFYKIQKLIQQQYGGNFFQIISVPYYLRVKILIDSLYIGTDRIGKNTRKYHEIILICQIEDVVKGDKYFKTGQQVTVIYYPEWTIPGNDTGILPTPEKIFIPGGSYFLPIRIWDARNTFSQLAIHLYTSSPFPIYPIKNGIISMPGNYYGTGETSNWETFKKVFAEKYILK